MLLLFRFGQTRNDAVAPMSMRGKSDIPFPNNVTVTYATWFNRNWQSSGCE